jgi:hypothetical protein
MMSFGHSACSAVYYKAGSQSMLKQTFYNVLGEQQTNQITKDAYFLSNLP